MVRFITLFLLAACAGDSADKCTDRCNQPTPLPRVVDRDRDRSGWAIDGDTLLVRGLHHVRRFDVSNLEAPNRGSIDIGLGSGNLVVADTLAVTVTLDHLVVLDLSTPEMSVRHRLELPSDDDLNYGDLSLASDGTRIIALDPAAGQVHTIDPNVGEILASATTNQPVRSVLADDGVVFLVGDIHIEVRDSELALIATVGNELGRRFHKVGAGNGRLVAGWWPTRDHALGGIDVYDVSEPASPTWERAYESVGSRNCEAGEAAVVWPYAFLPCFTGLFRVDLTDGRLDGLRLSDPLRLMNGGRVLHGMTYPETSSVSGFDYRRFSRHGAEVERAELLGLPPRASAWDAYVAAHPTGVYVSDGRHGLRVFDARDPLQPELVNTLLVDEDLAEITPMGEIAVVAGRVLEFPDSVSTPTLPKGLNPRWTPMAAGTLAWDILSAPGFPVRGYSVSSSAVVLEQETLLKTEEDCADFISSCSTKAAAADGDVLAVATSHFSSLFDDDTREFQHELHIVVGTRVTTFDIEASSLLVQGNHVFAFQGEQLTVFHAESGMIGTSTVAFSAAQAIEGDVLALISPENLWVYNVSDPAAPKLVCETPIADWATDIALRNGVAYLTGARLMTTVDLRACAARRARFRRTSGK